MPTIHHGIKTLEINTGARSIAAVSTAVIGLVAIASDADADYFPLNTPVLVTDIYEAIANAGEDGTLAQSLDAIADQVSPTLVIVRVAEGETDAATETNIIGTVTAEGKKTGLKALLAAEAQVGQRPRILGVPGLDSQDVAVELVSIAKKLRGMAYTRAIGATVTEAIAYAGQFSEREQMLIWPDFTGFEGDAVARAMGLRALIDQEVGWHKTLSNIGVQGVTGLSKDVFFDMGGVEGDATLLNDAKITALVQNNGYRFWGNRTCSSDPLFAFESTVRTAQVLRDTIAQGLLWAIDKPLTTFLVKDIIDTINALFRELQGQGRIIGATAWFDAAQNPQAALAGGKLVIDYDFTPVAPAESLTLNQRITDKYYANFADQLAAL